MELALGLFLAVVSFFGGAKLATSHKISVKSAKLAPIPEVYMRPCIGANDVKCDKPWP
jgi:hypothetical protein